MYTRVCFTLFDALKAIFGLKNRTQWGTLNDDSDTNGRPLFATNER